MTLLNQLYAKSEDCLSWFPVTEPPLLSWTNPLDHGVFSLNGLLDSTAGILVGNFVLVLRKNIGQWFSFRSISEMLAS